RWRREKRDPNLLNSFGKLAVRPRAFFDHARAPLAIDCPEIWRKSWRDERSGTIWNRQTFQQIVESQLLLLEKRNTLFQWKSEVLARALGWGLRMKPLHRLFAALHRRRAGRRKKQSRNKTANNRAVEAFILRQVGEHRIAAAAAHRELHRTLPQALFHFIKIDIVPTARVTDDHKRLRSDASPSQCPQIFV